MSSRSVLIFERDRDRGASLHDLLTTWGYQATIAVDLAAGLKAISELKPALVVDSSSTQSAEDFALVRAIRLQDVDLPVVLLTNHGTVDNTFEVVQQEGVYHYFEEPLDPTRLRLVLDRAIELADARRENELLKRQLRDRGAFGELVGNSDSMRQVYTLIEQVARRDKPFVAINCSAIPETLMESELFGHEKGAFTGAAYRRLGCFELADSGTLLLDEIGEMPALLQAKLLRVIEERAVRRLGSRKEVEVDVRLLAATNRNPQDAMADGKLRSDLLYRLNVFSIHLPSLSERKEDLPLLAQHLVTQLAEKHHRPARFLSSSALDALQFHAWPGNVRELRNVIERAVIICSGEQIERHHFAPYPIEQRERLRNEDTIMLPVGTPLEEVERQMIMRTLQKTKNNKTRAAELLGISLKTLHNKLNLYRERGLIHDD